MGITSVLLAGGRSSRFGINKLKLKVGPLPIFIDQVFKLSFFCNEIIISVSGVSYDLVSNECMQIGKYLRYYNEIIDNKGIIDTNLEYKPKLIPSIPDIKIVIDNINKPGIYPINNGVNDLDMVKKIGPIAGIYTGINNASNDYCLAVASDMPFISYRMIEVLVDMAKKAINYNKKENAHNSKKEQTDAFIIKTKKGFESLAGIYSKNCLPIIKNSIEKKDYKISNIFESIKLKTISAVLLESRNIDMLNFFNINNIKDYRVFKKIWDSKNLKNEKKFKFNSFFLNRWAQFFFR